MAGLFFAFALSLLGFLTPNTQVSADGISLKLVYTEKNNGIGEINSATTKYYATAFFNTNPIACASKSCNSGKLEVHWSFDSKAQVAENDNRNPIEFDFNTVKIVQVIVKDLGTSVTYKAEAKISEAKAVTAAPSVEKSNKTVADVVLDPLFGVVNKILQTLAFGIIGLLYFLLNNIVIPIIQVLLTIQPHDPSFSAVILVGWVFVRNVANILFIIAMIILGMATLLRVEKYNYKHLIPELVLMAIAVNFSLVVAQLVLGIADTFQAQFLPNSKDVLNALAHQLMVSPLQNISKPVFQGSFADLIATLVYFIFAVGTFFVFAAIAAFLVIRIVALWLLLMFSPVAYVGMILPDTHHEAMKWWSNFLKYAFQTPILGFFLHLCAVIAVSQSKFLAKATENTSLVTGGVNTAAQFAYNSLSSVLLLVCLMAGLEVAKELGTFGASTITGAVEKATHAVGVKPIEMLGEMGYKKAQRWKREKTAGMYEKAFHEDATAGKKFGWSNVLDKDFAWRTKLTGWAVSAINPDAAYKARHKEFEELNEEELKNVETAAEDMVVVDRSKGTQWHEIRKSEQEKQERAFLDHFKTKSAGELMDLLRGFKDSGYAKTTRGRQEVRSLITAAYQTGKIRDIVEDWTGQGEFSEEAQNAFFRDALEGDHELKRFQDSINDISKEKKLGYGVGLHLVDEKEYAEAYKPIKPHYDRLRDLAREEQELKIEEADPATEPDRLSKIELRLEAVALERDGGQAEDGTTVEGINEKIAKLKQTKEFKDHYKAAMRKRQLRQERQIRHWGAADLPAVNPTGIDRIDEGTGEISGPLKMYIKRMDKYNSVPLNQRSMEYFAGVKIDQKSGAFVFKTDEQKKVWDFVVKSHPSFAKRIYNAARGITYAGHPQYSDLPDSNAPGGGIPYYVRHTVVEDVDGKAKEIDKYMKAGADGKLADISKTEADELAKNLRTTGTRIVTNKTGKNSVAETETPDSLI